MEKITNIEIKNFKSIRHQKIDGCKRINVFVGYPNVGKSNILEALSVFELYKSSQSLSIENLIRFEDTAELFFEASVNEDAIISYNKSVSVHINFETRENVKVSGVEYDSIIDYTNANSDAYIFSHDLIDVFKYQFSPQTKIAKSFTYKHLQPPFGENLFLIVSRRSELRKSLNKYLEPYDLRLLIDQVSDSLKLFKTIDKDSVFSISYSLIADTLQRLFFYKTAIDTNEDAVLLFEEPEAHMFPPYIKSLTSDIILDKNDNQYFIATHSPFVLNELIEEAQDELSVYVVDYDKGETIIKRLTDEEVTEISQYGIDLFFNLESYLEKNGQPHSA